MSRIAQFLRNSEIKTSDLRHREILQKTTRTYLDKVAEAKDKWIDWNYGRELARQRKWEAIHRLDDSLKEFERHARARGTVVHWAENGDEACKIILNLCKSRGVRKVIKSKSMVTEEIHLNTFLEKHDITSVESDLGEYIVQLRHESPYHIITPAMHLTKEDINLTFHEKLGTPIGSTAEELIMTARKTLRHEYLTSEMGITGANFLVAETGMIVITENEGNARLSSSLPLIHVAVCGIEKVVPCLEDLSLFLPMLAVSGSGQSLTCYNTMIGGPRQDGETDGPDEFHVVLLDNGRTQLLADAEQREALHCIRCGACLNVCPVFKNIGGHAYGTTYQGPIGAVITPHLRGLKDWKHLSYASSLCGNCSDVCPVHIDLHHHLLANRRNAIQKGYSSWIEYLSFQIWTLSMRSKKGYRLSTSILRLIYKFFCALGIEGSSIDPLRRWSKDRTLPKIADQTFRDWWHKRNIH